LLPWSDKIIGTASHLHAILPLTNICCRVKAAQTLDIALPAQESSTPASTKIICTASSDGRIHIFDLAQVPGGDGGGIEEIGPEVVYDSKGMRLTCIALADGDAAGALEAAVSGKRKRDGEEEDDEDEGLKDEEGGYEDEDKSESESEVKEEEEVESE